MIQDLLSGAYHIQQVPIPNLPWWKNGNRTGSLVVSATSSVAVGTTSWTRKEVLCSISWSFPLRLVSTDYLFLWMCGESWLASKDPTTPVLKAGLSGLPCYIIFVCLSGLWLGGLPFFSFCYHKASVLYMHMCFHAYCIVSLCVCVCVCVEALVSIVMYRRNLQYW